MTLYEELKLAAKAAVSNALCYSVGIVISILEDKNKKKEKKNGR